MSSVFSCRLCGECCSGEMNVFLNPKDLDRLVSFHGVHNRKELFETSHTLKIIIDENKVPRVQLKFKTYPFPFCPYLENRMENDKLAGYCLLHPDSKPLICRLAPISRVFDSRTGVSQYSYIPPHPECPGCHESIQNISITEEEIPEELKKELKKEETFFCQLEEYLNKKKISNKVIRDIYLI